MKCPRCETATLDERERDGVTIDVCQQCRGIWLDRGELERLIARAMAEQDAAARQEPVERDYRDGHDDDHHHGHDREHGHYRKRSWLDIFD